MTVACGRACRSSHWRRDAHRARDRGRAAARLAVTGVLARAAGVLRRAAGATRARPRRCRPWPRAVVLGSRRATLRRWPPRSRSRCARPTARPPRSSRRGEPASGCAPAARHPRGGAARGPLAAARACRPHARGRLAWLPLAPTTPRRRPTRSGERRRCRRPARHRARRSPAAGARSTRRRARPAVVAVRPGHRARPRRGRALAGAGIPASACPPPRRGLPRALARPARRPPARPTAATASLAEVVTIARSDWHARPVSCGSPGRCWRHVRRTAAPPRRRASRGPRPRIGGGLRGQASVLLVGGLAGVARRGARAGRGGARRWRGRRAAQRAADLAALAGARAMYAAYPRLFEPAVDRRRARTRGT